MPTCGKCKGKKTVILPKEKSPLGVAIEVKCPDCKGMGEVGNPNVCQRCNDSKKVILPAEESPFNVATEVSCPDCSAPVTSE
ncbi:MAG TPA: hypothetical protein ENH35_04120 [Candidatus Moranbacteria bacterium]|nr:hypothetical protein [Candidatus Moranbacteria bacterium]